RQTIGFVGEAPGVFGGGLEFAGPEKNGGAPEQADAQGERMAQPGGVGYGFARRVEAGCRRSRDPQVARPDGQGSDTRIRAQDVRAKTVRLRDGETGLE